MYPKYDLGLINKEDARGVHNISSRGQPRELNRMEIWGSIGDTSVKV